MKKLILLLLSAMALPVAHAQSTTMVLLNSPAQATFVHPDSLEAKVYFELKNLTSDSINVMVAKINTQYTTGQNAYICWDFCYGSVPAVTDSYVRIGGGDSTGHGQYVAFQPLGYLGVASVTLRFINEANPTDFVEYTYSFESTLTGIDAERLASNWWSGPVTDRAAGKLWATFDPARPRAASESIRISSIQGKEVWAEDIAGSQTWSYSADQLPAGVYLISWYRDGQLADVRKWSSVNP